MKKMIAAAALVIGLGTTSGCAVLAQFGDDVSRNLHGVEATMSSYDQDGQMIDTIQGNSFNVQRDNRFDTKGEDGLSKNDSSVLLISLGDNHISHTGSTMLIAEDSLENIMNNQNAKVTVDNTEKGVPFLNTFLEVNRNLWKGKGKTLMLRSQDGDPIAIYAGDEVEVFATNTPKSTQFRVDGKYLFVYRADYTVYDNNLLGGVSQEK